MSDLEERNTQIMIAESKRMHAEVEDLMAKLIAQDQKITTLSNEVASLKEAQVRLQLEFQVGAFGSGGTA